MRLADFSKFALLVWLAAVIVAAFFYVHAAEGFIGESSRIVFFHVPMAWIAVLAFLVSCIASVRYLRRRDPRDDIRAAVSAGLGLLFAVLATLGGVGGGCGPVIAPSIQSDIIDYDEYMTGERKEGAYFAAFSFAFKGSTGLTLMLTGFVLQLSGFVPNVEQTETAKLAIRCLFALFPLVSTWLGALLLSRFALNRAEHAEVRAALDARRG